MIPRDDDTHYSGSWAYGNAPGQRAKSRVEDTAHRAVYPLGRWAFKNGEHHRPQFEDVILSRIDAERKTERQRSAHEEVKKVPESATSPEAKAIHTLRTETHLLAIEEATSLHARHTFCSQPGPVRSWHAPGSDIDPEEEE